MKIQFVLFCLTLGLFSSCSSPYTYFTKDLYAAQQWTADDIGRIQFYLSKDIVLSRSIGADETRISEGKIEVVNGRSVERVIIRARTPGILVHMPNEDRFAISFEEAEDNAFLMFGPNTNHGNRYVLLAQEWQRDIGQVHYKGNLYSVDASSAYSSLMVNMKKEGVNEYKVQNVSGRTVQK